MSAHPDLHRDGKEEVVVKEKPDHYDGSDIKVLEGRVVSGDQFVSPTEHKERILATIGDLCCEMEGCTIAQGPFQSEVSSRSVERRP